MRKFAILDQNNLTVETFTLSLASFQDFIKKIRKSVYDLEVQGRVKEKNIKISIPIFIQNVLEEFIRYEYQYGQSLKKVLGGFDILPGYNNQVCIFNSEAYPEDFFIPPFIICFHEE